MYAHLIKPDLALRDCRLHCVFRELDDLACSFDEEGEEVLAQACLLDEIHVLAVQDQDHIVEASDQVVAQKALDESLLASDFILKDLHEVLSYLSIIER